MDAAELVKLLTPLVGMAGREQLQSRKDSSTVALRYDHVNDWDKLEAILRRHEYELDLFDGQEWFHIVVKGVLAS